MIYYFFFLIISKQHFHNFPFQKEKEKEMDGWCKEELKRE